MNLHPYGESFMIEYLRILLKAMTVALIIVIPCKKGLYAGEMTLYFLPRAQLHWEGSGFRQFDEAWTVKVYQLGTGTGLRWREQMHKNLTLHVQYWRNNPRYADETGNVKSTNLNQTVRTKLDMHNLMVDVCHPLESSSIEVLAGIQGTCNRFQRQDIIFNTVVVSEQQENLSGLGAYIGFHGGRTRMFYYDWEATLGHLFLTHNIQTAEGGSIHREGFTYNFRVEAGIQRNKWRFGIGYICQLVQIMVPGGKTLPSGDAISLPINKFDFFSPTLSVSYVY